MIERASRYIAISEHANQTSAATIMIGVPLTLSVVLGYSPWPGLIFFAVSYATNFATHYCLSTARELHKAVQRARENEEDT